MNSYKIKKTSGSTVFFTVLPRISTVVPDLIDVCLQTG